MSSTTDGAGLWQRATHVLPGGVSSNTRLLGPPTVIVRGEGCRLWDADGREYIDCLLGQGPAFLGHGEERVRSAVAEATRDGVVFGATHLREIEAAELIRECLGWPDRVRLGSSSTEMVQAALRVARAATGRRRVVQFEGHYHGWLDNTHALVHDGHAVPASLGQSPDSLADLITLRWNDADELGSAFASHGQEIAAVIMEPMMINAGVIVPRSGYLELARELCSQQGAVLVFDETISGFRVALGGASKRFGVTPDLAVYGKAMAGGWPASALAGSADVMELFSDGAVGHFGTFNGNVAASAAIIASLSILRDEDPYPTLEQRGTRLMQDLRDLAASHGIGLHVQGLPMAFHLSLPSRGTDYETYDEMKAIDRPAYEELCGELLDRGVWVARRGIWYLSTAHGEHDLDELLTRFGSALVHEPVLARGTAG